MNEQQWSSATTPNRLFASIYGSWGAKASAGEPYDPERLRLFACSCCRRVWHLLDADHRRAVELLEAHVRAPTPNGLPQARKTYQASARRIEQEWRARYDSDEEDLQARRWAYSAVWEAAKKQPSQATRASHAVVRAVELSGKGRSPDRAFSSLTAVSEGLLHAALLRDIVVNPELEVKVEPAWMAVNGGAVRHLAEAIDADQSFEQLPVLADALEEAGCAEEVILGHCRGPGPHVRGCWVVDALVGRVV